MTLVVAAVSAVAANCGCLCFFCCGLPLLIVLELLSLQCGKKLVSQLCATLMLQQDYKLVELVCVDDGCSATVVPDSAYVTPHAGVHWPTKYAVTVVARRFCFV